MAKQGGKMEKIDTVYVRDKKTKVGEIKLEDLGTVKMYSVDKLEIIEDKNKGGRMKRKINTIEIEATEVFGLYAWRINYMNTKVLFDGFHDPDLVVTCDSGSVTGFGGDELFLNISEVSDTLLTPAEYDMLKEKIEAINEAHAVEMTPKEYYSSLKKVPHSDRSAYAYYNLKYKEYSWNYASDDLDYSIAGIEYISISDAKKFCELFNEVGE